MPASARLVSYSPRVGVDWSAEVVDQLESHWTNRLRPRLDGLSDAEYFWRPVPECWTVSRRGTTSAPISWGAGEFRVDFGEPRSPEPVTTIAWRLAHLIVGFAEMNGTHFGGPATHPATFRYAGTADEALRQLDEAYTRWIGGVRELGDEGLARPQGPKGCRPSSPMRRSRGSSCTHTSKSSTTVRSSASSETSTEQAGRPTARRRIARRPEHAPPAARRGANGRPEPSGRFRRFDRHSGSERERVMLVWPMT
jgi:DinB superfamily